MKKKTNLLEPKLPKGWVYGPSYVVAEFTIKNYKHKKMKTVVAFTSRSVAELVRKLLLIHGMSKLKRVKKGSQL